MRIRKFRIQNSEFRKKAALRSGFTLVEMMVALAIFVLISTVAVGMFLTILKSVAKTQILNEVKQNGDYAMDVMERMIRNAKSVQTCQGSMSTITITNPDGAVTAFSFSGVRIASNSGNLTGTNVVVTNGSFSCDPSNSPKTVNIIFTVSQAGSSTRQEDKATMYFRTAVSLRTYQ